MEVAEGVHRLTQGVVNFYLVQADGGLLLVDAGAPGDWPVLAAAVAGMGLRLDGLDAILLTHAHGDHIGFAERARTEADAQVWIHADDAAVASGAKAPGRDGRLTSYLLRAEFYRTVFSLARRGATRITPVAQVSTFADGERLDVPGRPRVVHAPGHTAGNAALLFGDRRVLLSGDSLVTRNPLTGRVGPQVMPSGFNADTGRALESLARLADTGAGVVLPGHGEPRTGRVAEAVRLARAAGRS